MRIILAIILVGALGGCTGKSGPILAGGKPVSHWVRNLSDPNPKMRKAAAEKLGNVGSSDPAVLDALCGALRDGSAEVRCEAILALVKVGPGAKEAVGPLKLLGQQDRDPRVRSYAAKALEKLEK